MPTALVGWTNYEENQSRRFSIQGFKGCAPRNNQQADGKTGQSADAAVRKGNSIFQAGGGYFLPFNKFFEDFPRGNGFKKFGFTCKFTYLLENIIFSESTK